MGSESAILILVSILESQYLGARGIHIQPFLRPDAFVLPGSDGVGHSDSGRRRLREVLGNAGLDVTSRAMER